MTCDPAIESGIPFPPTRKGGKAVKHHYLRTMEIGESVFVPRVITNSMTGTLRCIRPKKFQMRTRTEGGVKGVRIWRIK